MIRQSRILFPGLLISGLFVATATIGNLQLPPPYATPSADNHPTVTAKPAGASLHVPNGFRIEEWANGLVQPRFLLKGDHGEILLADSGGDASGRGIIYVFSNGNPHARKELIGVSPVLTASRSGRITSTSASRNR